MAVPARLLCIMGSGETAPTMRPVHADLLDRVTDVDGPAVVLDTPYGFQENAEELTVRTQNFFRLNVGHPIEVASWRQTEGDPLAVERALTRIRSARYVFAGPGSPTYALRQWRPSGLADAVRHMLTTGGCVTFASAAAVTLGVASIPVYEIYKAGLPPRWEEGLDLFGITGMTAAVIPHFDNREGGTHDTRYCYLGEQRLRDLERTLPPEAFVFGVDEHTACIIDLDRGTVEVVGRGDLTIRVDGRMSTVGSGRTVSVADVLAAVRSSREQALHPPPSPPPASKRHEDVGASDRHAAAPLHRIAQRLDDRQRTAIGARDAETAVALILELEQTLQDWSADTLTGDQVDRSRALLRGMVIRLGDLAIAGAADPRDQVAPYVKAVLDARRSARRRKEFALADELRGALSQAGVEVRDTPDGVEWELVAPDPSG